ncbi:MAG: hypothetical protein EXS22_09455 [Pedosphaera sp.]|nr:hypothetical protein [Pedosphaera sp.]MSU44241.1 hypothetical protein [Pedosphaera sp.]
MKIHRLALLLAIALSSTGWAAAPAKTANATECELCRAPQSRAALLLAQGAKAAPAKLVLDEKTVAAWLAKEVIVTDHALGEVQMFTESRVPQMPRVRTADQWKETATRIRRDVLDQVVYRGGAAAWRDTPLKVEWFDTLGDLPGYRIRKLRFEALPGLWIPALLYEPLKLEGKAPVVLNVNGHDGKGKAASYKQIRSINLVKRGMVVLNVEWIGMGQLAGMGHYQMNQLDLCGTSGLAPFYLNMKKALDVLLAHPNADAQRVAVSGLSGGGWQTIFISSLDERVKLCNPVAGYSSFKTRARHFADLGDSEQTPNDLAVHADYTHLTAMMADRAALLTYNAKDNCCFASAHALPPLMDAAGPIFTLLGRRDFLRSHINHQPGSHNFEQDNRQQFYRMVGDVFFAGKKFDWQEIPSNDEVKKLEELLVPLPETNLAFNPIALQIAKDLPRAAAGEPRARLRQIVHAHDYKVAARQVEREERDGVTRRNLQLTMNEDWTVPVIEFTPAQPKGTTLLVADAGFKTQAAQVKRLLESGQRVLAVDPFYFGQSTIRSHDFLFAMLVAAVGERALGIQASQICAVARWSQKEHGVPVQLSGTGPRLGVAALIAAVLEEKAIAGIELRQPLASLKEVLTNNWGANNTPELMCFGLLEAFDLPQLEALVKPRPVVKLQEAK